VRDPGVDGYKAPGGTSCLSRRRGPTFRLIGCRAVIYVREPRAGALPFEHMQRAEKVIDHLLIGLDETLRADAKCRLIIVGGACVTRLENHAQQRNSKKLENGVTSRTSPRKGFNDVAPRYFPIVFNDFIEFGCGLLYVV
jgi:hypothetical protein